MNTLSALRTFMRSAVVLGIVLGMVLGMVLVSGCNGLLPKAAAPSMVYSLDDAHSARPATLLVPEEGAPTLIVNPTRAGLRQPAHDLCESRAPVRALCAQRLD